MWIGVACAVASIGCGRIDFDPVASGPGPAIDHVAAFVSHAGLSTNVDHFTGQAQRAGDAVVFQVQCNVGMPSGVAVAAPGWTIVPIGSLFGMTTVRWGASFGAFAPDTAPAMFTVTWAGATCGGVNTLGDEFANVGAFDAHAERFNSGDCSASVTATRAGDAIWAACSSGGTLSGVSPGYTKSVDDGADDWTAYRLTTDPANTTESVTFSNTTADSVITMVALGPS